MVRFWSYYKVSGKACYPSPRGMSDGRRLCRFHIACIPRLTRCPQQARLTCALPVRLPFPAQLVSTVINPFSTVVAISTLPFIPPYYHLANPALSRCSQVHCKFDCQLFKYCVFAGFICLSKKVCLNWISTHVQLHGQTKAKMQANRRQPYS